MSIKYFWLPALLLFWGACSEKKQEVMVSTASPVVTEKGTVITMPDDARTLAFFEIDTVRKGNISATYQAPASVAVSITEPTIKGGRSSVLFDNPDLGASYSQFLQHLTNIKTFKLNLDRVKDLSEHGAATGKEVLEAETQLANEEAAITEHEAKLKIAGLNPEELINPQRQESWLLCEVPESQIGNIAIGTPCDVRFTAFPGTEIKARISGIAAEVDNITRMIKVRAVLPNPANRYQVGMFATVTFQLKEGKALSIPIQAVVNVQGNDYVFVQTSKTVFQRREILAGQQYEGKIVILHGLDPGEKVVVKGAMELKGLSFGY